MFQALREPGNYVPLKEAGVFPFTAAGFELDCKGLNLYPVKP